MSCKESKSKIQIGSEPTKLTANFNLIILNPNLPKGGFSKDLYKNNISPKVWMMKT